MIPCFNSASTLERALNSVVAQTLPPHEVIVVDDASTDDVRSVVDRVRATKPLFDLQLVRRESNHGPSAARNHGWSLAKSSYVAFLDADDEWFPSKLEMQFNVMRSCPRSQCPVTGIQRR
ncbi:MAG: glycosyltransferase family 2 protein [Actinomycetota bacterium]